MVNELYIGKSTADKAIGILKNKELIQRVVSNKFEQKINLISFVLVPNDLRFEIFLDGLNL